MVDVRKSGLHAARERLVARVSLQRVEPDQAVRAALQARHLGGQLLRLAAVPAVREQDDDRAAAEPAAVLAVERGERLADAGAARPVVRRGGGAVERAVGVAPGELRGDARQAACRTRTPPRAGGRPRRPACTGAACARRAPSSRTRRRRARAGAAARDGSRQWRSNGSPAVRSEARMVRAQVRPGRVRRRAAAAGRAGAAARAASGPRAPAAASRGGPPGARRPCSRRSPCRAGARRPTTPTAPRPPRPRPARPPPRPARRRAAGRAPPARAPRAGRGASPARGANSSANAASNAAKSSRREHNVARSAK